MVATCFNTQPKNLPFGHEKLWRGRERGRGRWLGRWRGRRGQANIIEAVLLFGLGFVVLTGIAGLLALINGSVVGPLQRQQLETVADAVSARAVQLIALNQSSSSFTIRIPTQTMGEAYTIFGSPEAHEVIVFTAKGAAAARPIPAKVIGLAQSSSGAVLVSLEAGEIQIKGLAQY